MVRPQPDLGWRAVREDWNQFQFAFLGPNSLTIVENAPSARVLGVETNVEWRANRNLTITAAAAINDAELTGNFCTQNGVVVINTCGTTRSTASKGQQLPYTPKFNGNITARYTFPLSAGTATPRPRSSTRKRIRRCTPLTSRTSATCRVTPRSTSRSAPSTASCARVFAKNVTDKLGQVNRYTPCTTSTCAASYPGVNPAIYIVPIQPLTVGIRVGQSF